MKNTNTISIANGIISIDKEKADRVGSMVTYLGLCFVKIILYIATGAFVFLTAVSAGDARVNDETHPFIALGFAVICGLSTQIVGYLITAHVNSARRRLKNYKKISKKACNVNKGVL